MIQCRLSLRTLAHSISTISVTGPRPRHARWLGTVTNRAILTSKAPNGDHGATSATSVPRVVPVSQKPIVDYIMGRGHRGTKKTSYQIRRVLSMKERLRKSRKIKRLRNSEKRSLGIWVKSPLWQESIRTLLAEYDRRKRDAYLVTREPIRVAPHWAEQALAAMEAGEDVKQLFLQEENAGSLAHRWEKAALWLMEHDKPKALAFMEATMGLPSRSKSHFHQMFRYLVDHYFHEHKRHTLRTRRAGDSSDCKHILAAEGSTLSAIRDRLLALLEHLNLSHAGKYDSVICRLLAQCDPESALKLYRRLRDCGISLTYLTWLQFQRPLTEFGKFELALETVFKARARGAEINQLPFATSCSRLLRMAIREPDGLRICLRLIDHLTKSGLKPVVQIWNILILNAAEAGDASTAFSIYRSMEDHGLVKDEYTFAAVLKACKLAVDDAELLNAIIREAIDASRVLAYPYVATEILHCLSLHHTQKEPVRAFETISEAYIELFNLPDLQRVGILSSKTQSDPETKLGLNPAAFGIMLMAYLVNAKVNAVPREAVYKVYIRWRELVLAGQEPYASMAQKPWTSNLFLHFFGRTEKGLTMAAQVVKDMQAPLPPGHKYSIAPPSVLTWTLFLYGFIQHGKMALAEQILAHMHKLGMEPLQGTYNNLILGYTKSQDIENAIDAIRRMEAAGFVWDEYTLHAVRKLYRQDKFNALYMKRDELGEPDFTNDLKDSIGSRLAGQSEQD